MEPRYSILYFKEELLLYHDKIRRYLLNGIKVFWFGETHDCEALRKEFPGFVKGLFLQTYDISSFEGWASIPSSKVVDGIGLDTDYKALRITYMHLIQHSTGLNIVIKHLTSW